MRQKIVLVALAVAMLYSGTAYAQKVVTKGSGETINVIIDATGMPSGAITKNKKPLTTTATNSTECTQDATDLASEINNEKVYQKFEVSKTDNSTSASWFDAVNTICAGTINGSTGWRLPTQRELMLIWVLHSQLKKVSGFTPLSNNYWCTMEFGSYLSWGVDFRGGTTNGRCYKDYGNYVRCVKEL